MDWELYAWVRRGKRRKDALLLFAESQKPLSVNEIKSKLKIAISQSSYTIKELFEKGLVECLNPKDKIGKLYKITKLGAEIKNEIL